MADILYRSDTLAVRAYAGTGTQACVVTFDNYGSSGDLERDGFGAQFFAARGIAAVTVVGRGNDWYHYPDTAAALDAVRRHVAGYDRVVTYGSSMGGYAALRFAGAVGADAVLALSPQYSIQRDRAPYEPRWWIEAANIGWIDALEAPLAAIPATVVHDTLGPDRHHAAAIARESGATTIAIPFGGHPVATYLGEVGLLEPLVHAVLEDRVDAPAFRREALARRRQSAVSLIELAHRLAPRRSDAAIAVARRAVAMHPDSAMILHGLATLLTAAGKHSEALPLHAQAVARSGGALGYVHAQSEALEAAGDRAAALSLATDTARRYPAFPHLRNWRGFLLWKSDRRDEAIVEAAAAAAMAPHEAYYAETLALYRRKHSRWGRVKRWAARHRHR